jgi:hypothetical protein
MSRLFDVVRTALREWSFDSSVSDHVVEYCQNRRGAAVGFDVLFDLLDPKSKAEAQTRLRDVETFDISGPASPVFYDAICVSRESSGTSLITTRLKNQRTAEVVTCEFGYIDLLGMTIWFCCPSVISSLLLYESSPIGILATANRWSRLLTGYDGVAPVGDASDPWIRHPPTLIAESTGLLPDLCLLVVELAKSSVLVLDE